MTKNNLIHYTYQGENELSRSFRLRESTGCWSLETTNARLMPTSPIKKYSGDVLLTLTGRLFVLGKIA